MAKNVQGVIFLRNNTLFESRELARQGIVTASASLADGQFILARYNAGDSTVKTLVGVKYSGSTSSLTIIDMEGASADVQALREEINAKLGTSFISSGNTVEANLTALSGNSASDTSATTSVEGAKKYADALKSEMDYTGVTTGDGVYITNVIQADGIVSATAATLPTVTGEVESKKVVMSVSEDKGTISVAKGTIESADKTVVISDLAEGNGIDFKVNIDNDTLIADTGTGVISVASAALTQYVGDDVTIEVSAVDPTDNTKTISSLLTIQKVTTGISEEVKEEYHLVGSDNVTIGDPVKIYKDSHIVSIEYQDDPAEAHYQNLIYTYVDVSGNTQEAYVDISELVLEAEFASGITVTNHIAHGVVDPTSEKDSQDTPVDFLTVGADGFKVSGIKAEIDRKLNAVVENLDATVGSQTVATGKHVAVEVVEENGVLTALTVTEDDIASASDLTALSAKTITDVKSANGSVTVTPANAADGTQEIDLATDASKIKMTGFTTTTGSSLTAITTNSTVTEAFEEVDTVITAEIARAMDAEDELEDKIEALSGASLSGVSVNNVVVPKANNVAGLQVSGSQTELSTEGNEAIIVDTDPTTGAITLGLGYIDCGTY